MALCFICKRREGVARVQPFDDRICEFCSRQFQDANFKSQRANSPPPNPDLKCFVIVQPPGRVIRLNGIAYAFEREHDAGVVLKRLQQDQPRSQTWIIQKTFAMKIYDWAIANKSPLMSVKQLLPGWENSIYPPEQWFKIKKTPDEIAALQARRTPEAKSRIKAQRQRYRELRAKRLGHL